MVNGKLNHMEIFSSNIFHIWNNLMIDWFNFSISLLVNSNVTKVIKFIIMEGWLYKNESLFAFSNSNGIIKLKKSRFGSIWAQAKNLAK